MWRNAVNSLIGRCLSGPLLSLALMVIVWLLLYWAGGAL
jgi:hypothetical protein